MDVYIRKTKPIHCFVFMGVFAALLCPGVGQATDTFTLDVSITTACDHVATLDIMFTSTDVALTQDTGTGFMFDPDTKVLTCDLTTVKSNELKQTILTISDSGVVVRYVEINIINILITLRITDPVDGGTVDLSEAASSGDVVYNLKAYDETDDYIFSITTQSTPSLFTVNAANVLAVANSVPDGTFTFQETYSLTLRAVSGDGAEEATADITVQVVSSNQHVPAFSQLSYTAYIPETAGAGTTVTQLTATDDDVAAPDNVITYSLSGSTAFVINANTGLITVAADVTFNYSVEPYHVLTVTANDWSVSQSLNSVAELNVTVQTAPLFGGSTSLSIPETAVTGDILATITATDVDSDDNLLTFSVVSQSPSTTPALFEISGSDLLASSAVTSGVLDADTSTEAITYTVVLRVSDGTYQTDETFTLTVINVNDEPPTFSSPIRASIPEWATAGLAVATVSATDNDSIAPYNNITYSIPTGSPFIIDVATGAVSVATGAVFDFSTTRQYTLIVTATDGGAADALSATTQVEINIQTRPVFESPVYGATLTVLETLNSGETVTGLTATDKDGSAISFTVVSQTPDTTPKLFALSGSALVAAGSNPPGTFDQDATSAVASYSLQLRVSDGTYVSDVVVTVAVENTNDHAPEFNQSAYTAVVRETLTGVHVVTQTPAEDADSISPFNVITYSITGSDLFTIDPNTGVVSTTSTAIFDHAVTPQYVLTVTATDGGTPAKSTVAMLTVGLATAPMFVNLTTYQTIDVYENINALTSVYDVLVEDKDSSEVTISIVSQTPSSMFELDDYILVLKDGVTLDAEAGLNYTLSFSATDGLFTTQSANLLVHVMDRNDNPPVLSPETYTSTVPENLSIGSEVLTVTATDADVSVSYSRLLYVITAGNELDTFDINGTSGTLTLIKIPNALTYRLTVTVGDGGIPPIEANATLDITVNSETVDECLQLACENEATCFPLLNSFYCECTEQWMGKYCNVSRLKCDPNPCLHAGTCTETVDAFSCSCGAGWTGDTCADACTGNTWGPNCADPCTCVSEHVLDAFQEQQCHARTGQCLCKAQWQGATCNEDYNECSDATICAGAGENRVCENEAGGYRCVCMVGYKEDGGLCVQDNTVPSSGIVAGEAALRVGMSIPETCPDLSVPSNYQAVSALLKDMLEDRLNISANPLIKRVVIISIRCGSIVYEAFVVIVDSEAARSEVAIHLQEIRDRATLSYAGSPTAASALTVDGTTMNSTRSDPNNIGQLTCDVFETIERCPDGTVCKYENGKPFCRQVEDDNTTMILALGLGIVLPLLMLLVCFACCYYFRRNHRQRGYHRHSYDSSDRPWQTDFPTRRNWPHRSPVEPWQRNYYDNRAISDDRRMARRPLDNGRALSDKAYSDIAPNKRDLYGLSPFDSKI
ncbi:protocadherin Fat 4-like [Mya arenaria]|uniref:protocadherin Fat 4-like n=1 Tax=Mya arenaria TaxID=6604 RepID=UPI0022E9563A|nr:protocadherin Fat 4-like [Mya arenaria]